MPTLVEPARLEGHFQDEGLRSANLTIQVELKYRPRIRNRRRD